MDTLGEAAEQFDVVVHVYCLMPNHYHLVCEFVMNTGLTSFTFTPQQLTTTFDHTSASRYCHRIVAASLLAVSRTSSVIAKAASRLAATTSPAAVSHVGGSVQMRPDHTARTGAA
ncbi:MAG: hypothetical protein ABSA97_11985 [Verrucomicrobiia bacterium]